MRLDFLFQVAGYHNSNGREFELSGILFSMPRFPCRPQDLLKHSEFGLPSLGSFMLIPTTPETGLMVPILGGASFSNSIIVELKLYRALEDKIGYHELNPLKGCLLPIYLERYISASTYQEHIAQSEPYFQQLKDRKTSPVMSLAHCWQPPDTTPPPS